MPKPSLRDALIEAGLAEFSTRGYSATGINALTARAGAPRGSFYGHFATKEAFAVEVVAAYVAGQAAVLPGPEVPAGERVRREFGAYAAQVTRVRWERGCVLGILGAESGALGPEVRNAVVAALDGWADRLAATLREAYGRKKPPADLRDRAADLIAAWETALWQARLVRDVAPIDRFLEVTLEAALP